MKSHRKYFTVLFVVAFTFILAGCAALKKITPVGGKRFTAGMPLASYSGPRARLRIADFKVKATNKITPQVVTGLKEMLIFALINSNRFSVVELPANIGRQQQKHPLANQTELILSVSVTAFEPQTSGGVAGVGGAGGLGSGILGGLMGASLNKAYIAMDIQVTDVRNAKVLLASHVDGQASDTTGSLMGGFFTEGHLGSGLAAYANTPMEKAIRICIIEAVRYISKNLPEGYYKY
jgi:curli biogenesis system outer membrane secretion channel CsgG